MKPIRCIIVDDEPYARDLLVNYIKRLPELQLLKSCMSAAEAFEALHETNIDLMFLDIQMPVITGTDFLRSLVKPPLIIFTTAHAHFAVEGFELNSVDYLLKPITFERFHQAIQKAVDRNSIRSTGEIKHKMPDYLFIKQDNKLVRINHREIDYIQAEKDFSSIYIAGKRILAGMHLKILEGLLPANLFIRVHRSYMVSLEKIIAIKGNTIELGCGEIPIGELYKEILFTKLNL